MLRLTMAIRYESRRFKRRDLDEFGQKREISKASFFVAEWDSAGTGIRSAAAARGLRTRVVSYAGPAMRKQGSSRVDPDYVASCVGGCAPRHVLRRVASSGWSQQGPLTPLQFSLATMYTAAARQAPDTCFF